MLLGIYMAFEEAGLDDYFVITNLQRKVKELETRIKYLEDKDENKI